MTHTHRPLGTDRSPLATAVVSISAIVVFFGFLVAASYPLVTAAAIGGAVLALATRRAVVAARDHHADRIAERTTDRPPRAGSRSRHS